jgi:hypothetical protein
MSARFSAFILALVLTLPAGLARAQTNLVIYNGSLASGWQDWSYTDTDNLSATSPVHGESHSISVTITGAWGAFVAYHPDFDISAFNFLSFWLNGGSNGGQNLQIYATLGSPYTVQNQRYYLSVPAVNTWRQYIVSLDSIGVAGATNFTGFAIQDSTGSTEPTFYLDDIVLTNISAPAVTKLSVNASQTVRSVDARWFGVNVAVWDNALDTPDSISTLQAQGIRALRFPGGSDSDDYHWLFDRQDSNTWTWSTTLGNFIHVATNVNAETMITLNYGTGTSNEAAAWVAYVNAPTNSSVALGTDNAGINWRTAGYWAALRAAAKLKTDDGLNFLRLGRVAPLGFKDWEVGNEEYGGWETDSNAFPNDPYTYAARAVNYIKLARKVDPTVKIGVVVTPGEDSYVNETNHAAVNPRTGVSHYGWTPVLLATMKALGQLPDFLIHHVYPQPAGGESDVGLLQASGNWSSDAANLRQMLSDYVGAPATNIELLCTENNSVSTNPGKQSVSLVNGLFKADSLAQLMQTEFNGLFWWNLRNGGVSTNGNTNAALYGWREYGDYGVLEGANYFPTYYTTRLMQDFVQPGDTILAASSDYSLLPIYAARRADGRLAALVINKDSTNTLTGQIALGGFLPSGAATLYSYGEPQDNAAQTGLGSPDVAQTNFSDAATNFSFVFPPYSATVFVFLPAPATLSATAPFGDQLIFQIQGQPGVPYILQNSVDLQEWTSISTNTVQFTSAAITNTISPTAPAEFWRVVWKL